MTGWEISDRPDLSRRMRHVGTEPTRGGFEQQILQVLDCAA